MLLIVLISIVKLEKEKLYTYVITIECPSAFITAQHISWHAISFRPSDSHRSGRENFELEIPFSTTDRVSFLDSVSPEGQLS